MRQAQPAVPHPALIQQAIDALASGGGIEARGAIFTRPEVVDFILDLVGYTPTKPLYTQRLLEPAFGGGDFLLPIVDRLLCAWEAAGQPGEPQPVLGSALRAVELHRETFAATYAAVVALLTTRQIPYPTATALADQWLRQDDFLLTDLPKPFDYVVGNPPYVRQEMIPAALVAEYRRRYPTMYDRADLYIPFLERALRLLVPGGGLGFICADRWMKNRYGGPLRQLVADHFHLKIYVDMVGTPAFQTEVSAYPAITVITRDAPGPTRLAHRPAIDRPTLTTLATALTTPVLRPDDPQVRELARVPDGSEPWLLETADQMALLRRLEAQFPLLEATGCKVGIGVATGADKAFLGDYAALDVEPDRKLPLVTTKDILHGEVNWRGQGVINPFAPDGGLVDLAAYPKLRRYLEDRYDQIAKRHCAQKTPTKWYRTIDRIFPELVSQPKLLIPDIKGAAHIVYEAGHFYPHHNLYYVTATDWDLRALQAVLLSAIGRFFVATYATKMRGGFLRFQAQYLRRIRLPQWAEVPLPLREELATAATQRDLKACNQAVFRLYNLTPSERAALCGNGD